VSLEAHQDGAGGVASLETEVIHAQNLHHVGNAVGERIFCLIRLRACADRLATFHICRFSERSSRLLITYWYIRCPPIRAASKEGVGADEQTQLAGQSGSSLSTHSHSDPL
jgi:hypothetical protein